VELRREVVERLLVSKSLLGRIRFQPTAEPDHVSLASQILAAHDAAELALAAISDQLNRLPAKDKHYLMDYFERLKGLHPDQEVFAKEYFSQLNRVRVNIKHHGLFPDAKQWARVGETVYGYISKWCSDYLEMSLEGLDESSLLKDPEVKARFDAAWDATSQGEYRAALESLGIALFVLFANNAALRDLAVGNPNPDDAIKLAGFGVHANDFLALQEFLPNVIKRGEQFEIAWKQGIFGHPGNWREQTARFCLNSFLDVALKIQDAEWIPSALPFSALYEYRVVALKDGVEIWKEIAEGDSPIERLIGARTRKETLKVLAKGESLRGMVSLVRSGMRGFAAIGAVNPEPAEILSILTTFPADGLYGYVARSEVNVTCVPRQDEVVKRYFGDLPEINWEPE